MATEDNESSTRRRYRLIGGALLIWVAVVMAGSGATAGDSLLGVERLDVLWVILLAAMALVGLVILIVLNPFGGEWVQPERKRDPRGWLILIAVLAILMWKPDLIPDLRDLGDEAVDPSAGRGGGEGPVNTTEEAPETVAQLGDLLLILLAACTIALVVFLLRMRSEDNVDDLAASEAALEADLAVALEELTVELEIGTDPRAAVLAAYALLESVLSDHGSTRSSAETPTEHLRRSMARLRIDDAPFVELGQLYEVARFSDRPISRADQQHALRSLERARAELASLR